MLTEKDIVLKIVFRNCVVKFLRNGEKSISRIRKQPDRHEIYLHYVYKFSDGDEPNYTPSNLDEEIRAEKIDYCIKRIQEILLKLNNPDQLHSQLEDEI